MSHSPTSINEETESQRCDDVQNLLPSYFCSACTHAKLLESCLSLCDPMDCSLPGSFFHGILQARILGWVAMSSSRESSNPGIQSKSLMPHPLAGRFFTTSTIWEAHTYALYRIELFSFSLKVIELSGFWGSF